MLHPLDPSYMDPPTDVSTQPLELAPDKLEDCFKRQAIFMRLLLESDRMVEWPVDLTSKAGQRLLKEVMLNLIEELMEASFTLKNRMHRMTDARNIDIDHYREELGDTFAYFMEICILSGIAPGELYKEYCRKNEVVTKRLRDGY